MCSWLGNAAVLVINHNMIYSLMGGTASCVGRGGLNHFCDLKTCKNRIFSKEILSHSLLLDSISLLRPDRDEVTEKASKLTAPLAPKTGRLAWRAGVWGGSLNLLLHRQKCLVVVVVVVVGSYRRFEDGQK